eukprot:COSAG02_NODE_7202_length_3121_cov_80.140635_1_plen_882_part_10
MQTTAPVVQAVPNQSTPARRYQSPFLVAQAQTQPIRQAHEILGSRQRPSATGTLQSVGGSNSTFHEAWLEAAEAARQSSHHLLALDAGVVSSPTATVTMAVLQRILSLAPEGAAAADAREQLPLHVALKHRQPIQALRLLLDAYPAAAVHPDEDGHIPLHIVLRQKPFRRDVFAMLLTCNDRATQVKNAEGDYALHMAAALGVPVEAVKAIHAAFPGAIELPNDKSGSLPLHLAVSSLAMPEVYLRELVDFLIKAYPEGAQTPDKFGGKLPLHHAVQTRAPRTVVLKVFTAHQGGCRVQDTRRFYPYQYCDFAKVEKLKQLASNVAVNAASSEAEALKAFRKIDKDGSGDLDLAEIEQLARYFGKPLSPKELDEAFEEMDTDRSGTVDCAEFMVWWRNQNKTGRSASQSKAAEAAKAAASTGQIQLREEVDDAWHEEMFALLSVEVLGERMLLMGRPPREMLPLYERAAHIYTSCYIELFGTYKRPEKLLHRLTTVRALCEVHEKLADLMFPVDPSLFEKRRARRPDGNDFQSIAKHYMAVHAEQSVDNAEEYVSSAAVTKHYMAHHGKRATGDEEGYVKLRQQQKKVGTVALQKVKRQMYRQRNILDFNIEDGVVERNLVGIVENCDRAFELTENGFQQPIPQHKLRKIQQDALVALSNWVEPAAIEFGNRMSTTRETVSSVLDREGGIDSNGAKQWDARMQKEVIALVERAEKFASESDHVQAEALFRTARKREGNMNRLYPWNKGVDQRLEVGLARSSQLANVQRQKQVEKEAGEAAEREDEEVAEATTILQPQQPQQPQQQQQQQQQQHQQQNEVEHAPANGSASAASAERVEGKATLAREISAAVNAPKGETASHVDAGQVSAGKTEPGTATGSDVP